MNNSRAEHFQSNMENVPGVFFWLTLQEPSEIYAGELTFGNDALSPDNTIAWEKTIEKAEIKRAPTR